MGTILLIILILLLVGGTASVAVQLRLGILAQRRTRVDCVNRNNPRFDGKPLSRQLCSREAPLDHFGLLLLTKDSGLRRFA